MKKKEIKFLIKKWEEIDEFYYLIFFKKNIDKKIKQKNAV